MNEKLTKIFDEVDEFERQQLENSKFELDYKKKKLLLKFDLFSIEKLSSIEEYTRIKEFSKYLINQNNNYYLYEKDGKYCYVRNLEHGYEIIIFEDINDEEYLKLKKYSRINKLNGDGSGFKAFAWIFLSFSILIFGLLTFELSPLFIIPFIALLIIPIILFSLSEVTGNINDIKEQIEDIKKGE